MAATSSWSDARLGTYPAAPADSACRTELGAAWEETTSTLDRGETFASFRDRLMAARSRQQQVQQDQVGLERTGLADRLLGRGRLTDRGDVLLQLQPAPQARPEQRVVVDDQDADHRRLLSTTTLARVPPTARGASSSAPPNRPASRRHRLRPSRLPPIPPSLGQAHPVVVDGQPPGTGRRDGRDMDVPCPAATALATRLRSRTATPWPAAEPPAAGRW